jgi:hypothetical protein
LTSKYSLAVTFCVAVLTAGCGDESPTPRIPSDLSLWKQVEIPEPPKIATIPLEAVPPKHFWLLWSPDDRRLAYFAEDDTVINIHDFMSNETRQIIPGGRLAWFTTEWHPSGKRFLVGTCENTPTYQSGHVQWAESLKEYDIESGTLRRRFNAGDLGGFVSWVDYSPDGNRLLVFTRRHSMVGPDVGIEARHRARATQRKSIVAEDGSVKTVMSGEESPSLAKWSADGSGLIYERKAYTRRSRDQMGSAEEAEELMYRPIDEQKPPRVLDRVPSRLFETNMGLEADVYPDVVGVMPYWKKAHIEFTDVSGGELFSISQCELWEYEFSTETRSMVIDFYALFDQLYDGSSLLSLTGCFETSSEWCRVNAVRLPFTIDFWYVSLGPDRVLGRLPPDFGSWHAAAFSPNKLHVAYVDDEPAIHILDLGAVLPKSGGGPETEENRKIDTEEEPS